MSQGEITSDGASEDTSEEPLSTHAVDAGRSLLPRIELGPKNPENGAVGCVIWLHGLGADGHDLEPIIPYLRLPSVRFVLPHAPKRSISINGGAEMPAWYNVRFLGPEGSDRDQVQRSRAQIEALIEHERLNFPASRIVLAGFSQGGAMALYTGVRYHRPLLGIVVLSAYELMAQTRFAEAHAANRSTPVLFCHGTFDPVVPVQRGRQAHGSYAASRRRVEWHEYPIGHEVSMSEIQQISDWLTRRFGDDG